RERGVIASRPLRYLRRTRLGPHAVRPHEPESVSRRERHGHEPRWRCLQDSCDLHLLDADLRRCGEDNQRLAPELRAPIDLDAEAHRLAPPAAAVEPE